MKRTIFLFVGLCLLGNTKAQEVSDSVTLSEVTIEGARVMNTVDGLRYYPTQTLKEHSSDTWQLLQGLALPALTVDVMRHSVTGPPLQGDVQIRVNDVVASREDLMALNPRDIERVEYTDHPGVRYGQDVGYVVNIITRRRTQGYEVGAEAGVSTMRWMADGSLFGKVNHGASEWQVSASTEVKEFRHLSQSEEAHYHYADGTTADVMRFDIPDSRRQRHQSQQLALRYSFVLPERLTLQAALSMAAAQMPQAEAHVQTDIVASSPSFTAVTCQRSHSLTPTLDLYASVHIAPRQTLTANIVGTLIRSHYAYDYQSVLPYFYESKGRTQSLQGEVMYEYKLKPLILTAGLNFLQKHVENGYTGDAVADEDMRQSSQRLFAELKGKVGILSYKGGLDFYRQYFHLGQSLHTDCAVGPRLSLSLPLGDGLKLTYDGFGREQAPRLEYRTCVEVRENEWIVNRGNPNLRSEQYWQHRLAFSYQSPRLYTQTSTAFRDIIHPYMTHTGRQGTDFVTWRENQRRIRMLWAVQYLQWQAIPQRLQLSVNTGVYRMLNYGNDYFHALTFVGASADATAFLGRFTLFAHYDSGWHFMENEVEGRQPGAFYVGGNCTLGDYTIGLYWQNPLRSRVTTDESWTHNRYAQRHFVQTSRDTASLLNLTFTWRFSHGRQFTSPERKIRLSDDDSGLVQQK